ncbi:hypothetical protein LY04_00702 [Oceanimonas baumannii]|uniref:Uncharacterized protein n=1 Tax=Oceanimonas baumannii TaxID=129578 RepID=A0ABY2F1P3_9GAMM|nr:hypothetical protein LY04_00702 [Oceanimonas baumannii]
MTHKNWGALSAVAGMTACEQLLRVSSSRARAGVHVTGFTEINAAARLYVDSRRRL